MKKYYDWRVTEQPSIEVGDLVMLNAKKIKPKRPSKKPSTKLYGPFKVVERKGSRAYMLEISPPWKVHPVLHISLWEPSRALNRPNHEQPRRYLEDIEGDLEWDIERIVQSEIIS